jgi:hypothetical protein
MSLTNTQILAFSNAKTRRGVANIDSELIDVCIDISGRYHFLTGETAGTLDSNAKTIMPNDYACPNLMIINDEQLYDLSMADYLQELINGYHILGTQILVTKNFANDDYIFHYGKLHGQEIETLEFEDRFKPAIVAGVNRDVFRKFQMFAEGNEWNNIYEVEINKLIAATPAVMEITEIRSNIRW